MNLPIISKKQALEFTQNVIIKPLMEQTLLSHGNFSK